MNALENQLQNTTTLTTTTEANPWLEYGESGDTGIVGELLRFKLVGKDEDRKQLVAKDLRLPIEHRRPGTRLVADMNSPEHGHLCWHDGKVVERRMGRVVDGFKPTRDQDLPDRNKELWLLDKDGHKVDPWQSTHTIVFADPTNGQLYTFSSPSKGGQGAIKTLSKEYGRAVREHPNEWPIIELGVDDYAHSNKQFGRVPVPCFFIVGWIPKTSTQFATDEAALSPAQAIGSAPQKRIAPPQQHVEEMPPWVNEPGDPGPSFSDDVPW